jgi:aryl-alcohol dehydrogenase
MRTEAAVTRPGSPHPVLEPVELEDPAEGEVLVRIAATGVCHTDLHAHEDERSLPIVLGHEGAGVVEAVGPGAEEWAVGDRVLLSASPHCGACARCRQGATTYCEHVGELTFGGARLDGTTGMAQDGRPVHGRFFGQSSFARHALGQARAAVRLPGDLPLELLAAFGCGVSTGAGSVLFALGVRAGESVAVFGTGGVGLSAIMAARVAGARRIVAVDVVPARLELALELGATHAVDARAEDPVEAVRAATGGGADAALNTTRTPAVYDQALASLAVLGRLGFVGPPPDPWAPDVQSWMLSGRSVQGIVQGGVAARVLVPLLIDLHRQGRFPVERLVRAYPFAEIGRAFADSAAGTTVKPVLVMEEG